MTKNVRMIAPSYTNAIDDGTDYWVFVWTSKIKTGKQQVLIGLNEMTMHDTLYPQWFALAASQSIDVKGNQKVQDTLGPPPKIPNRLWGGHTKVETSRYLRSCDIIPS